MKHHAKLLLATTALALACAPLLASAAGKSMGKSNLRAQKIAQDARMPQQPRTMAESDATKFTTIRTEAQELREHAERVLSADYTGIYDRD